jgi:hypothetical protein
MAYYCTFCEAIGPHVCPIQRSGESEGRLDWAVDSNVYDTVIKPCEPFGPYIGSTIESIEKSVQAVHVTCASGFHVMAKDMNSLNEKLETLNSTILELLAKMKELCR